MTQPSAPGLLVSVRSAAEACAALAGGAALIDVKEPAHGPLGRASDDVIRAVMDAVGGRCAVSAALGELADHAVVQQYGSSSQIALMQAPPCESLSQPVVSGPPLVHTSWSQRTDEGPPSTPVPVSPPVPASSPALTAVSPKQLGAGLEVGAGTSAAGVSVHVAPLPSGKLPEKLAFGECISNSVHSFSHL